MRFRPQALRLAEFVATVEQLTCPGESLTPALEA